MANARHAIPFVWLQQEAWNWAHPGRNNRGRSSVTRQSRVLWEQLTAPLQNRLRNLIDDFDTNRTIVDDIDSQDVTFDLQQRAGLKRAIRHSRNLSDAQRALVARTRILRRALDEQAYRHMQNQDTRDYLNNLQTIYQADHETSQSYIEDDLIADYHDLVLAGTLGEGWVGSWRLGRGGFGTADLLVKQNSHGMIIDRVVIKDTVNSTEDSFLWTTAMTEPTEVGAMEELNLLPGSDAIVFLRNWRLGEMTARAWAEEERPFRLFLEFCPGGDFWSLKESHWPPGVASREQAMSIPEPFAWHAFESLAMAGKLMASGSLQPPLPPNWEPIIHRDIKMQNIFIGENMSGRFPGFPMPKLGDFGQAVFVPINDPRHPDEYRNSGTNGNFPPEQLYHRRPDGGKGIYTFPNEAVPRRLTSAANVWAIGNVIWSLLMLRQGDRHMDFLNPAQREPELEQAVRDKYSQELQDLVMDCVSFMPEDRPSIDEVLRRIRGAFDGDDGRTHTRGLRSRPARSRRWNRYAIMQKQDRWPVRSMLADAAPLPRQRPLPEPPREAGRSPSNDDTDDLDDLGGQPGLETLLSDQSVR